MYTVQCTHICIELKRKKTNISKRNENFWFCIHSFIRVESCAQCAFSLWYLLFFFNDVCVGKKSCCVYVLVCARASFPHLFFISCISILLICFALLLLLFYFIFPFYFPAEVKNEKKSKNVVSNLVNYSFKSNAHP